jgi:hypothetical protein
MTPVLAIARGGEPQKTSVSVTFGRVRWLLDRPAEELVVHVRPRCSFFEAPAAQRRPFR